MLLTFAIMLIAKSYQSSLKNTYNASTCPSTTIDQDEALYDQQLDSQDRTGLMHCY